MAQEIADSTLLDTWASSGLIVEPDISKIIEGWQLGEQPPHEYMNWFQNTLGSKLNHILKNGVASWNNETEYLAGSSVQHNGDVWLCKTKNTNSAPTDANANWKRIITVESLTTLLNGYIATTGDQTIAGVKTFSSKIVGNIDGNSNTATKLSTNRTNYKDITDSVVVGELMWKNHGNYHTIFDASNSTTPTGEAIDNTNPDIPWNPTYPTLMGYHGPQTYGVRVDSSRYADKLRTARKINGVPFDGTADITIDDSAWVANDTRAKTALNASGSAPIYACRAWVNFNGSGTVAIRASGNVSSITDNGVGFYTVNFTTAMPDANYSASCIGENSTNIGCYIWKETTVNMSTSQYPIRTVQTDTAPFDPAVVQVSIFR